jgi:hypothetical protein
MEQVFDYSTVSEATSKLREEGYTVDFNLEENCIVCSNGKFETDEFEIVKVFRYEGNTDPADEAAVYAIESKNGLKGILVTGYGIYSDPMSTTLLQKLPIEKNTVNPMP